VVTNCYHLQFFIGIEDEHEFLGEPITIALHSLIQGFGSNSVQDRKVRIDDDATTSQFQDASGHSARGNSPGTFDDRLLARRLHGWNASRATASHIVRPVPINLPVRLTSGRTNATRKSEAFRVKPAFQARGAGPIPPPP
jgi:hypothetical protein